MARILIADAALVVAKLVATSLQRLGHTTVAVQSMPEAIESFQLVGPFDAVVSDLSLALGNGAELHRILTQEYQYPTQRIIFTLASSSISPEAMDYIRQTGCPVLIKPDGLLEISELVSQLKPYRPR